MARGPRVRGFVDSLHDPGADSVVTSVGSADTTLTITPTLGNVLAKINLANANTWSALQTFSAGINVSSSTITDFEGTNLTVGFGVLNAAASLVTDVVANDTSLTISPTTGNVLAELNINNANTWTALQTFSSGISASHGGLTDLLVDDHTQYALLAGRAGGQSLTGGTASGNQLTLKGSTHADRGHINIQSQILLDVAQANQTPEDGAGAGLKWTGGPNTSGVDFLMRAVRLAYTWTPSARAGAGDFVNTSTINYRAAGGNQNLNFALYAVKTNLNNTAHSIPNVVGVNWLPFTTLTATGSTTVRSLQGFTIGPVMESTASGGTLTVTNGTKGMRMAPQWQTLSSGATIDFNDVVGLDFISPAHNGFGSNAGTKRVNDYIGMRVADIGATLTQDGNAYGFQSLLTAAADRWMFRNDGGAKASFGLGSALFGTVGSAEFELIWDGVDALDLTGTAINFDVTRMGFFSTAAVAQAGTTDDIKDALTAYGLLQGTSATPLNLDGGALTAATATLTTIVISGDSITDFAGTGLTVGSGVLNAQVAGTDFEKSLAKHFSLEDPISGEDRTWFYTNIAITVVAVEGVLAGGTSTPTIDVSVMHHTDRSDGTPNTAVDDQTVTSITTGDDLTLDTDVTIPAASFVWVETTDQSGTVPELALTLRYTED